MNEHSTWIVKNEFALSTDSWIHYVWINYFSQIVDSTIHETFVSLDEFTQIQNQNRKNTIGSNGMYERRKRSFKIVMSSIAEQSWATNDFKATVIKRVVSWVFFVQHNFFLSSRILIMTDSTMKDVFFCSSRCFKSTDVCIFAKHSYLKIKYR